MRNKPRKYEIKIFWCCNSSTAYLLKGEVFAGPQLRAATLGKKNKGERDSQAISYAVD